MHDFETFAAGPLAHWWPDEGHRGESPCCRHELEVLIAPNGDAMVVRCGDCKQVFCADDAEAAA